jgi:hypothetical protein
MTRIAWGMMVLALAALLMVAASQPAAAQQGDDQGAMQNQAAQMPAEQPMGAGEYPNVSSLQPFSPEANYMSVPGYLRWQVFRSQGTWLSYAEARRIVVAQGGQIYHAA